MIHSESMKELAAALAKAQGELGGAKKDSTNPHFRSKYADLASVVEALKGCFPKHGLSYVQTVVTNDHAVGVETMLLHASGEWIKGDPFYVPVNKADAQGFGSCLTYCRRYSLAAIAGVAPEDDDGNAATAAKPTLPGAMTAAQVNHDAFASLPADAQAIVREHAMELITIKDGSAALAFVDKHYPQDDHEGRMALWSQLPSDVRSKIKKARAPALASQP